MSKNKKEPVPPKVPLRDIEIDEYLLECVVIEPTMLDEEFTRIPVDLAYWNERYSDSIRVHLISKLEYEQVRARIGLEVRSKVAESGVKKTVGDIDAMVSTNPEVSAAYLAYVEADAERQAMRNRVESVNAKREMLQSLGAKMRAEIMSDPGLRDRIIADKLNR